MKEVQRKTVEPFEVRPGDVVRVTYTDGNKEEHKLASHDIDKAMMINTVIIFELEDGDFGLEAGYGAAIGEEK